ncbi:hypothetical protein E2C01_002786 [Portunus trituberculatus]|uniref:Uncharacterized protein n=1 Tax=Portunus trituberculatus TaxID=210409 RepID=A0A5B7CKN6_PORTR|nr:hypothetical protein [Portunus trituberculatus]
MAAHMVVNKTLSSPSPPPPLSCSDTCFTGNTGNPSCHSLEKNNILLCSVDSLPFTNL